MNSEYETIDPKQQAFMEQRAILEKRILIFRRTVFIQALLLILFGIGTLAAQEKSMIAGPFYYIMMGRPWALSGLGTVLLLFYLGSRWKNLICGAGALLVSGLAMIYSPFLRVSYAWSAGLPSMEGFSIFLLLAFLLCYLLPFSILLFHISAFFRWRKFYAWCAEQMDRRLEKVFEPAEWKFRPVLILCLFLFLAGITSCLYDVFIYQKAADLSDWEIYTLPQTQVSIKLPVEGREEFQEENSIGVQAIGDRLSVSFAVYEEGGVKTAGEDQLPDLEDGRSLISNDTGMMGAIEYRQTITRQNLTGITTDVCIRSFQVEGRQYIVMIVAYERMEGSLKKVVEEILDSIVIENGNQAS